MIGFMEYYNIFGTNVVNIDIDLLEIMAITLYYIHINGIFIIFAYVENAFLWNHLFLDIYSTYGL